MLEVLHQEPESDTVVRDATQEEEPLTVNLMDNGLIHLSVDVSFHAGLN